MNKRLEKIKNDISLAWHSIFYGMKGANDIMFTPQATGGNSTITANVELGGVFQDMLQQKETQQVKETRDAYYRVLNEADKFHVEIDPSCLDENGNIVGDIKASSRKKTLSDFLKHPMVDESDGNKLRVIQDNYHIQKDSSFAPTNFNPKNILNYDTTLTINRGDFRPTILIEKFVSRIVVKNVNDKQAIIDLYLPTEPSQFNKIEAIVVANLNRLFHSKDKKDAIVQCESMEFISEKAWNSENLQLFKYDNIKFEDIIVFNGHFVLRFSGNIISDGESITKKFETDELDKKYKENAPKSDAVNIFSIERQIHKEINNLETTTLKL